MRLVYGGGGAKGESSAASCASMFAPSISDRMSVDPSDQVDRLRRA